jgi:hypothetical protein
MLETIAKGRLDTGRPSGKLPKPDAATAEQRALDEQRREELLEDDVIERQREQFNFRMAERTEIEREYNELRDLMLEQMKQDDEIVKKYIAMI